MFPSAKKHSRERMPLLFIFFIVGKAVKWKVKVQFTFHQEYKGLPTSLQLASIQHYNSVILIDEKNSILFYFALF